MRSDLYLTREGIEGIFSFTIGCKIVELLRVSCYDIVECIVRKEISVTNENDAVTSPCDFLCPPWMILKGAMMCLMGRLKSLGKWRPSQWSNHAMMALLQWEADIIKLHEEGHRFVLNWCVSQRWFFHLTYLHSLGWFGQPFQRTYISIFMCMDFIYFYILSDFLWVVQGDKEATERVSGKGLEMAPGHIIPSIDFTFLSYLWQWQVRFMVIFINTKTWAGLPFLNTMQTQGYH